MAHHQLVRPQTTIAAGSDGASLPAPGGIINVTSTTGPPAFSGSGTLTVQTSNGPQTVTYTGTSGGNSFTGCTGGTGTMSLGGAVADAWLSIQPAEMTSLDTGVMHGMNGVDGGCGAPTSQINVSALYVYAPTVVFGGNGSLTTQSNPTISLQDNDWPVIDQVKNKVHANRTVTHHLALARGEKQYAWHVRREDGGLQAWAPMFSDQADAIGMRVARAWAHIRSHDGATLTSLKVNFRVSTQHAALPSTMPQFRVFTVDTGGNALMCTSQASGADKNGYVIIPTPGSAAQWYQGGAAQSFTIPIDQNNVCSVGTRDYIVEIVEEQGLTGWPWQLTFAQPCRLLATSNIAQQAGSPTTVDGVTVNAGDRILCIGQASATQNGIWVAATGTAGQLWSRATDFAAASFKQGFVVPITSGQTQGNRLLQVPTSIGAWDPRNAPVTQVWAAGIAPGACVLPTSGNRTGLYYLCMGAGVGGSTEPKWPTVIGQSVADPANPANISWLAFGKDADPLTFLGPPDMTNPPESAGLVAHGTIFQSVEASYTNIRDFRPQ